MLFTVNTKLCVRQATNGLRALYRLTVRPLLVFIHLFSTLMLHLLLAGNSGSLNWVRLQQPLELRHPFLSDSAVFSCVQTMVWLPMFGIFNVRIYINACEYTRGLTDT